ncbi:MAG TPA: Hsp20/alpha crystallin family protein, partial [Verrucomicrobiae bacterium]
MKLAKHHEEKGSLAPVSRSRFPFWPVQRLQQQLDRLFEHPFSSWLGDQPLIEDWMPAISLQEEKNTIVVKAELPGMKKDEIEV